MEKNTRIGYIDLMKGICIILVVIHNGGPLRDIEADHPLLNSLLVGRMPLYFFLSGLFFRTYGSFGAFATRKICQLVVPMIVFGVAGGLLLDCIPWTQWSYGNITNPARYGMYLASFRNVPLWFLRALFVGCIMAYGLRRLLGDGRRADFAGLILTIVAGTATYLFSTHVIHGHGILSDTETKIVFRCGVFNALAMLQFLWLGMIAGKSGLLHVGRNAPGPVAADAAVRHRHDNADVGRGLSAAMAAARKLLGPLLHSRIGDALSSRLYHKRCLRHKPGSGRDHRFRHDAGRNSRMCALAPLGMRAEATCGVARGPFAPRAMVRRAN